MELMDIEIDGRPEALAAAPGTHAGLFAALRAWAASRNRVVMSIALDDQELAPDRERSLAAAVLAPGAKFSARTLAIPELLRRMLSDLRSHASGVDQAHESGAKEMIGGNYGLAMKKFEECFKGWALLAGGMQEIRRLCSLDFKKITAGTGDGEAVLLKVVEALTRFKEAFLKKDVVQVGDVAQYELRPLLGEWRALLAAIERQVSTPAGA